MPGVIEHIIPSLFILALMPVTEGADTPSTQSLLPFESVPEWPQSSLAAGKDVETARRLRRQIFSVQM